MTIEEQLRKAETRIEHLEKMVVAERKIAWAEQTVFHMNQALWHKAKEDEARANLDALTTF